MLLANHANACPLSSLNIVAVCGFQRREDFKQMLVVKPNFQDLK